MVLERIELEKLVDLKNLVEKLLELFCSRLRLLGWLKRLLDCNMVGG